MGLRKAVVIVAYPRSGTHLTLDFIRRNFPVFDRRLAPWQSARRLYVGLDRPGWQDDLGREIAGREHILLQTHRAGVLAPDDEAAIAQLQPAQVVFLYPFRRFALTMRSFAELCGYPGPVEHFLDEPCRFLASDETVAALAERHAAHWLARGGVAVDVEALASDPDRAAARLGDLIGVAPRPLARRLPGRRPFRGALAEAVQRLTGRESTEVRAAHTKAWAHPGEPAAVDARFARLYDALAARSLL